MFFVLSKRNYSINSVINSITNEFSTGIIQNRYYIYEFRKGKTFDSHRLTFNLSDKINLMKSDKYINLSNRNINYAMKKIKKSYKNNIFKISAPTWHDRFELLEGSYFASDIQDHFEYIIKTPADNPPI